MPVDEGGAGSDGCTASVLRRPTQLTERHHRKRDRTTKTVLL